MSVRTLKQAERAFDKAREILSTLRARHDRAKNQALVGLYFKYWTCYSCPQSDADHWWLYAHVHGVTHEGRVTGWSFQIDKDGKIEIDPNLSFSGAMFRGGNFIAIRKGEFDAAYAVVQSRVAAGWRRAGGR